LQRSLTNILQLVVPELHRPTIIEHHGYSNMVRVTPLLRDDTFPSSKTNLSVIYLHPNTCSDACFFPSPSCGHCAYPIGW
jgi:hypothetical protein